METKPFKVREIVKRLIDNRGRNADYYMSEKYPVIDNYMIKNELYPDLGTATRFLSEEQFRSFLRGYVEKNDLLMTLVGGVGNVTLAPSSMCAIVQNTIGISFDEKICDNFYAYYYFKTIQYSICSLNRGVSQPSVNREDVLGVKVWLPSIKAQKRIVGILETFDRLIEINNKRIKVLEQMAENLYKEWFVRFRFPGHESVPFENGLPQGWRKAKLKDIAIEVEKPIKAERRTEYQHYLPIDTLPSRRMALLEEDEIDNAESSLLAFEEGDILIGAMRPYFHKVILAPFKGLTRSTCFVVNSINPKYRLYLYLLLFQDSSINYATTVSVGSTMPYARWKDFSRLNIIFPAISVIERFNHYVEPIMTQIIESYSTYCNLSRQRDMLLPRLMSGKLEV